MATATAPPPTAAATANGAGADARQVRKRERERRAPGVCPVCSPVLNTLGQGGCNARRWAWQAPEMDRPAARCAPPLRKTTCADRRLLRLEFAFPPPPLFLPQSFLAVYEKLRDELVADKLLGDQPAFAKAYVKEVSGAREGRCKTKRRSPARAHALTPPPPTPPPALTACTRPFLFLSPLRCSTSTSPAASSTGAWPLPTPWPPTPRPPAARRGWRRTPSLRPTRSAGALNGCKPSSWSRTTSWTTPSPGGASPAGTACRTCVRGGAEGEEKERGGRVCVRARGRSLSLRLTSIPSPSFFIPLSHF